MTQDQAGLSATIEAKPEIIGEAIATLEGQYEEALERVNSVSPRSLKDSYTFASFASSLRHRDEWNIEAGRLRECIFALSEDCPSSAIRYFEEEAAHLDQKANGLIPCEERDDLIDQRNTMRRLAGQLAKHYGRST